MQQVNHNYKRSYLVFLISIVLVFFYSRPLNSPWHKFIAGDGFGYYSYLPATFIYHDYDYSFKWFNNAYHKNYEYGSFENPEDNLLVKYGDKKINKYYPGLSFAWLPFFMVAHASAKLLSYPADGFSLPYQLSIGLASLVYLMIGLLYLRKLLWNLYANDWVATVTPIAMFYGSWLFYYSLQLNSLSHVYSFTFIVLFLYFLERLFNTTGNKTNYLIYTLCCLMLIICIRPLNGLILFAVPGFFRSISKSSFKRPSAPALFALLSTLIMVSLQFSILYIQTGSFMPYTYAGEYFNFENSKFPDVLFSYHAGTFVYVPLFLLAFAGAMFIVNRKQRFIFPLLVLLVIFIYSSWWYWPVVTRTLIDFYPLLAIMLAAFIYRFSKPLNTKRLVTVVLFILVMYHQLKSMQLHNGILSESYTYSELFWRNFFRLTKTNIYPIPPKSIMFKTEQHYNFESDEPECTKTQEVAHSAKNACLMDKNSPFSPLFVGNIPNSKPEGPKKLRFSFWCYFGKNVQEAQIYLKLFNKKDSLVAEVPYYINNDVIRHEAWDYKEFGYDFEDSAFTGDRAIDHYNLFIWNNEAKNFMAIDDVSLEFIVTDRSYEIMK